MDIGDLIYLVIVIGAVIASIIKKKMDSAGSNEERPKRRIPDSMKEMFPDIKELFEEQEMPVQPKPEPVAESKTVEATVSDENKKSYFTYDNSDLSKGYSIFSKENEEHNITSVIEENPVMENFDLRKAVIYSTIIHRPEY